jgi:hypothetical protein
VVTDIARFDVKWLSIVAFVCSCLALVCFGLGWYSFASASDEYGSSSLTTLGGLGPIPAAFSIWLCWFAFRIGKKHGLRPWLAIAALVVGLLDVALYASVFFFPFGL